MKTSVEARGKRDDPQCTVGITYLDILVILMVVVLTVHVYSMCSCKIYSYYCTVHTCLSQSTAQSTE